jgi:hypothetical protein
MLAIFCRLPTIPSSAIVSIPPQYRPVIFARTDRLTRGCGNARRISITAIATTGSVMESFLTWWVSNRKTIDSLGHARKTGGAFNR